jgi:hypothetical protein
MKKGLVLGTPGKTNAALKILEEVGEIEKEAPQPAPTSASVGGTAVAVQSNIKKEK